MRIVFFHEKILAGFPHHRCGLFLRFFGAALDIVSKTTAHLLYLYRMKVSLKMQLGTFLDSSDKEDSVG